MFNRGDPLTRDGVRMNGSQRLNVSAGVASVAVALVLVAIKGWALWVTGALSVAAIVLAMINVVGGFLVTHRMLMMFQRR